MVILTFLEVSATLHSMYSPFQAGSGRISALAGRCRTRCIESREFLDLSFPAVSEVLKIRLVEACQGLANEKKGKT